MKTGRVRIIASGSTRRLSALPEVPTVSEQGFPGFDSSQWFGLLAPAGTPAAMVTRIAEAARRALQVHAVQERLKADGTEAAWLGSAQFTAFIKSERERWGDVVRKSKLKVE
jgi:tripartite-type tricarboxylate transporter receptor subunit TctC